MSLELLAPHEKEAVERWREFMRFESVSGEGVRNGSYKLCAEWIVRQCLEIGFKVETIEPIAGKPIVIATLQGTEPTLGRIILNSHYDVVPVVREEWCCDPFAAELRDGYPEAVADSVPAAGPCVYGRGAQDMKCVVVQYLEAFRRLLPTGWTPTRTVFLTFVFGTATRTPAMSERPF